MKESPHFESEQNLTKESKITPPYLETVKPILEQQGFSDYLSYHKVRCENGEEKLQLFINGIPVLRLVHEYQAPLLLDDTRIAEKRAKEWRFWSERAAEKAGYCGGSELIYAAKANPSSAIVAAAERAGCGHETSSFHDLLNLYGLILNGIVNPSRMIVCNGFIVRPDSSMPSSFIPMIDKNKFIFSGNMPDSQTLDDSYADLVVRMAREGFNIIPVLDSQELPFFREHAPKTNVGLRLKFGKVTNDNELSEKISRLGMSWEELQDTAELIKKTPNLTLTMFHTMVGAAETIPIDQFISCLSFAADKYFQLRLNNPSLKYFNIGGGMAPKCENGYSHSLFLSKFFEMMKEKAAKFGQQEPKVIFEFGSFIAAESGFYVFQIIQRKKNDKSNQWVIVNGGIMEAIPDIFILKKKFYWLAANNVESPAELYWIGDTTCDGDGKYPQQVLLPQTDNPTWLVIPAVGAYQKILAGQGGIKHCVQHEPQEVIVEEMPDGLVRSRTHKTNDRETTRETLGYTQKDYQYLKDLK